MQGKVDGSWTTERLCTAGIFCPKNSETLAEFNVSQEMRLRNLEQKEVGLVRRLVPGGVGVGVAV